MTSHRAIQELLTAGESAWQKVDKWLGGKSFPLIEGPHVTWIWRGNADGVNAVQSPYPTQIWTRSSRESPAIS